MTEFGGHVFKVLMAPNQNNPGPIGEGYLTRIFKIHLLSSTLCSPPKHYTNFITAWGHHRFS